MSAMNWNPRQFRILVVSIAVLACGLAAAQRMGVFSILKSTVLTGDQADGTYLLPTGQLLHPWGDQTLLPGRPVDMTLNSTKRQLAVLGSRAILLLDGESSKTLTRVPIRRTSYAGIAFRPGDRELWASETTANGPDSICVLELDADGAPGKATHIELSGHPVPVGIAFSADGKLAYVAFSRSNALAVFDTATRQLVRQVDVGMAPHGVAVSPLTGKIFVTNRGGRRPQPGDSTAPSSGSDIVTDPISGSAVSGTISVIDAKSYHTTSIAVGLAPSHILLSPDQKLLVTSNGHSDSISLIDTGTLARTDVRIPSYPNGATGGQPITAAFSPDGNTLYVGSAGSNALTVLTRSGKGWTVTGAIPSGWFPTALAAAADGSVLVLNLKGTGYFADPKLGPGAVHDGASLSRIPAPTKEQLAAGTREVQAANNPSYDRNKTEVSNLASLGIEHVFFIVKENRTYDQVFGDLPQGNGEPKFCVYGREITPNQHALAEQFVLLDNYYASGAISFDGHQWLMQTFVSDYVERAFAASPRGYKSNMTDALVIPPVGFFWQGRAKPLQVRLFGEFQLHGRWNPERQHADPLEVADLLRWPQYWQLYKEGRWQNAVGARSGVPALEAFSSERYPANSALIPDMVRAEEFLRELREKEKSGTLENLMVLTLSNDHTAGVKPGVPTPRAMVAANDLAVGQLVEGISHSKFWPKSLILIVEDDAQDGLDHVDGHRTVALAIGPMIRRGAVDSNNYNHVSLARTVQDIFQIPPRTTFAKAARPMRSLFTTRTNAAPFRHLEPRVRLDEMNPPLQALQGSRRIAAELSMDMDWSGPDLVPEEVLNRILWAESKGYETPYPEQPKVSWSQFSKSLRRPEKQ